MRKISPIIAAIGFVASAATLASSSAIAKTAGCTLIVNGKQFISGPCEFTWTGNGGFQIRHGEWFAYVNLDGSDGTTGWWNNYEGHPTSHADSYLGILTRQAECWSNEHAMVCAK